MPQIYAPPIKHFVGDTAFVVDDIGENVYRGKIVGLQLYSRDAEGVYLGTWTCQFMFQADDGTEPVELTETEVFAEAGPAFDALAAIQRQRRARLAQQVASSAAAVADGGEPLGTLGRAMLAEAAGEKAAELPDLSAADALLVTAADRTGIDAEAVTMPGADDDGVPLG